MNYPQHLQYTRGHQWLSMEGSYAFMGITDFIQRKLGRIVLVTVPYLNKMVESEKFVGSIEAAQTVLDLFMPVTGTIVEINPDILKKPGLVNLDPYHTWLLKIRPAIEDNEKSLLTFDEYTAFIWLGILRRVTMSFRGKRSMYLAGGRVQQTLFQHFKVSY